MSITKLFPFRRLEFLIAFIAILLSGLITYRVNSLGMVKTMVDQNSHLNLSREVIDSLTPGISQIGFWPPLLHILMIPFVSSDYLYQSGLAGFFTLAPFLAMGAVFLYKTINLLIKNKAISFFGTLIFLLNPYILYYTATPMMEILFMGNLFATCYFVTKWLMDDQLKDILLASVFVAISTVSRFEGMFLIPIVGFIIIIKLIIDKKNYSQIESLIIISSLLSMTGFVVILVYGYMFGGNPLAFMNSVWSAANQQKDYFLPTQRNLYLSLQYFLHASYHLISTPYILLALLSLPVLLLFKPRFAILAAVLILFSPAIFDFIALYRGNAIIYVPELPPYGTFFNERYGLYWAGFIVAVPILIIGNIFAKTYYRKYLQFLGIPLSVAAIVFMLAYSGFTLYKTAFVDNYSVIKQSAQGYPSKEQIQLAESLQGHYDYGKILMTRALHDFVAVNAKIPLKNYIQESNYKYFDQALHDPWLFARYVVMFNPQLARQDKWAAQNEKVSVDWGRSQKFLKYYTLVMENSRERLYKVKDDAVIQYAINLGYNPKEIPSINRSISWWNPDKAFLAFKGEKQITER